MWTDKPSRSPGLRTIITLNWRKCGWRLTEGQSAGGAEEWRAGGVGPLSCATAEGLGGADRGQASPR
eukprot:8382448-Alexandrium_andersonii.AAC.1